MLTVTALRPSFYINKLIDYVRWVLAAHQNLYAKNAKYHENRENAYKRIISGVIVAQI